MTNRTHSSLFARLATVGVLLLGAPGCAPDAPRPDRPNFLVILADDLGFSDLGFMGSEIRTPNLDRLAAESLVFTNFRVAPTCSPTRAMLLTGTDTHPAGLGTMSGDADGAQVGRDEYAGYMTDNVVTVASLLRDAGYHTVLSGKWHLGSAPESLPGARGFVRSFGVPYGGASHFADRAPLLGGGDPAEYMEDDRPVDLPEDFFSTEDYTDRLIEYIDEASELGRPFMAYAAYTAPHWPLQVPDEDLDLYSGAYDEGYDLVAQRRLDALVELGVVPDVDLAPLPDWVPAWNDLTEADRQRERRRMELYSAMVENLDRHVGRLLDHLRDRGLLDNTVVFFASDNGAEGNLIGTMYDNEEVIPQRFDTTFANMGRVNSYVWTGPGWARASTAPFRLFKGLSTEGGVRTPAILRYPGGRTGMTGALASIMDITPTFLEMAGVEHPASYRGRPVEPMQGVSLTAFAEGRADEVRGSEAALGWELFGRRGIYKDGWKLVWLWEPYGGERWELYDVAADPGETRDLASSEPEKLAEMLAEWDAYVARNNVLLPDRDMGYGLVDGGR